MTELDNPADSIVTRLVGGLGNQLFIYATARATAERLGCPLLIDISGLGLTSRGGTKRQFELRWLVPERSILKEQVHLFSFLRLSRFRNTNPQRWQGRVFREAGFDFDPRIATVKRGTTMIGYFQSWRYFTSIEESLRSEIFHKPPTSPWFDKTRESLKRVGPWVGVHVRRGDYLRARNKTHHGLLGRDYYRRALQQLDPERSLPLVVFSDDPKLANDLISPIAPIDQLIVPPKWANPIESLLLMSQASRLVIANSSYSWWGAWLGGSKSDSVVAPDPWFAHDKRKQRDLYMPAWVTLPSAFV